MSTATAYTEQARPTAYLTVDIFNTNPYSSYSANNGGKLVPIFSPSSACSTRSTMSTDSFPFSPCVTPNSPCSPNSSIEEDDSDDDARISTSDDEEQQSHSSKRIKSPNQARKSSSSTKKLPSGISKKAGKQKKEISKDEIKKYFNYSQSKAAKLLGISVSTLKRRFYSMNMGRWPYPENRNLARKRSISYICSPNSRPEKQLDPHTLHALFRAFKSTKPEHNNILPTPVSPDNESQ